MFRDTSGNALNVTEGIVRILDNNRRDRNAHKVEFLIWKRKGFEAERGKGVEYAVRMEGVEPHKLAWTQLTLRPNSDRPRSGCRGTMSTPQ